MNIGFVIGRIGGIDGVALETEKWIEVLRRMGHQTCVVTGALEGEVDVGPVTLLPELAFDHPLTVAGQQHAFFGQPTDEAQLLEQLEQQATVIERGLLRWIAEQSVTCLVSENASALPCHLTMGMALRRVFEGAGLEVVTHDHDFAWERGSRYETPYEGVQRIIADCFPVKLSNVRHAVINRAARASLEQRFGITGATVVPNVMDFDQPLGVLDDYNADLRPCMVLGDDDLLLFQITRIVERKGIETAIELVHRLADPRIKLVITGTAVDDSEGGYLDRLERQIAALGLQAQVVFAGHRFNAYRGTTDAGAKVYSLGDAYAHAAACTYFSTYEGFGNAFVEAVVARRPIFVNNYEPVYWPDIGSLGFKAVMIEGGQLTDEAVAQVRRVLDDAALRRQITEHNFRLGEEHFSYQALQQLLERLFPRG